MDSSWSSPAAARPALLDGGRTLNFPQLWAIVHIHEKFFIFYAQLRIAMRKFAHGHEKFS
jgi:hypothetical protein